MEITGKQRKQLLKSQQGELDAVLMYRRLAKRVKKEQDREAFLRLASDEDRHASVFYAYTKTDLKPKHAKAILIPLLYRLAGPEKVYPLIAKGEYGAAKKYVDLLRDFPEVERVLQDENHHGDAVLSLLK